MNEILDLINLDRYVYDKNYIYWNDKNLVLRGEKKYGWSLQYASIELQNDKEIVLKAVKITVIVCIMHPWNFIMIKKLF